MENVIVPIATVDTWMDWKKVVQWAAMTAPVRIIRKTSFLESSRNLSFFTSAITSSNAEEHTTLPRATMTADTSTNCATTPASPKEHYGDMQV